MQARYHRCEQFCNIGQQLVNNGHFASKDIKNRIKNIQERWQKLRELAAKRKTRLDDAAESHQVRHTHIHLHVPEWCFTIYGYIMLIVWRRDLPTFVNLCITLLK